MACLLQRNKPDALSEACQAALPAQEEATGLKDTFWKDGKRFLEEDEVDKLDTEDTDMCDQQTFRHHLGPFLTHFSALCHPHTRRAMCAAKCPYVLDADWCLQSDRVPELYLFIYFIGLHFRYERWVARKNKGAGSQKNRDRKCEWV